MASAPESLSTGGIRSGAGAAPVCSAVGGRLSAFGQSLAIVIAACGGARDVPAPAAVTTAEASGAADPASGVTTELDGVAPALPDGVLAELTGDVAAARAAFGRVLAARDAPPAITARAALHLAQLEARAGNGRRAADLAARAKALAPADPAIAEGVKQLEIEAAGVRGPRPGTPLPGVEPAVADAFAAAEGALARVREMRPRVVIEALSRSIRAREDATEELVARYRAIAEHGGIAEIAADYRIGSLYHDLAVELVLLELPAELDPAVAGGLHRTLRARALDVYLKKAVAAYRAALAVTSSADAAEPWQLAAQGDLRAANDLLGER